MASPIWRMFDAHDVWRALTFAELNAGKSSPARMLMIAITTSSSINVKAARSKNF
jgi:hypothetical protein